MGGLSFAVDRMKEHSLKKAIERARGYAGLEDRLRASIGQPLDSF